MSSWFQRTFRFNASERHDWVATQARAMPAGSKVLDVGAGVAPYRHLFAHCEYKTHDFGKTPETIGRYTTLDYESDITSIPVANESFDVVVCTEVLEHVPDPALAVKEISRILRPGGRLLLTAPLASMLHQEPYHFYGGYTPHWYQCYLPAAGFRIEEIVRNQGFFSFFGQEAIRFSAYIDPRRTRSLRWIPRGLTAALWLVTAPVTRGLLPLVGRALDRLGLESASTVGYHVLARKHVSTTT